MKEIVKEVVTDFLAKKDNFQAQIPKEKLEEMVFNRLASKYKAVDENPTYSRIQSTDIQIKAEAAREIAYILNDISGIHT
ncbi:MAG: hypothetical protein ABH858_07090 [Candidatus Omnitrophota bacterium]